jgi:porin
MTIAAHILKLPRRLGLVSVLLAVSWPMLAQELPAASTNSASGAQAATEDSPEAETYGGDIGSRSTLTGNWGGLRDQAAAHGVTVTFNATYVFQGVASGGFNGPLFNKFSDEQDTGNTLSSELKLELDTEKAGLWHGGSFAARLDGRTGRSVLQRAGSVSAVNNDALFPNVVDSFDEGAVAVTEVTFTQYLVEKLALFGGLLNTAEGDENELAGSALSTSHFLNSALLYSLVEDATVPNVALGGGVIFEPNEHISGSISVFGTQETAGEDPFENTRGTTFATEWTLGYQLLKRPGAQTFGFLYGIDASRTAIAADPRLVLGSILAGQTIPTTSADTWAFYYNAHQYVCGDSENGWGIFARFGISDGDPNPVKLNLAGGLGGKGLLPQRRHDTWGVGIFYLNMSNEDLLKGLNVGDETGGEVFYNIALTPWFHVTLDAQVIDSALPHTDTAWVLGIRTHINF